MFYYFFLKILSTTSVNRQSHNFLAWYDFSCLNIKGAMVISLKFLLKLTKSKIWFRRPFCRFICYLLPLLLVSYAYCNGALCIGDWTRPRVWSVVTFCLRRRRRKMYCGHARLLCVCVCVCLCPSVCLSAAVRPHYCTDPNVTWRSGRGCPLLMHYWADLQSVHGLRCYGNITRTLVTSLRPSRDMTT